MKLYEICFSPTGGTKKAASILLNGLGGELVTVDLTDSQANFSQLNLAPDDVALIAVPSYSGRVPAVAVERLSAIKANGARAVLLCVYGNRAYEDTLVELEDAAKACGFNTVAAVAAIAEHSVVRDIAAGRPDEADRAALAGFAARIREKLDSGSVDTPAIPGNRPYRKAGGSGMVPAAGEDCIRCGLCAQQCPVQAIDSADPTQTDGTKCISCMRCVAICPVGARKLNPDMQAAVSKMLHKACTEHRECELYT